MSATDDSLVRLIVAAINSATAEGIGPKGWMFVFGDMATGNTVYASNLEREGAIDALEQIVEGLKDGSVHPGQHIGGKPN